MDTSLYKLGKYILLFTLAAALPHYVLTQIGRYINVNVSKFILRPSLEKWNNQFNIFYLFLFLHNRINIKLSRFL